MAEKTILKRLQLPNVAHFNGFDQFHNQSDKHSLCIKQAIVDFQL